MIFPVWVFNLHDSIVASLGFVCNVLLIVTVLKRTSPAFRHYGHMVLVSSINDVIYSITSLTCRRVIELKNGYLFHMGYGLETKVPHAFALFIEFMNEVVCMQVSNFEITNYRISCFRLRSFFPHSIISVTF
jgi:hypothetical protein